MMGYRVYFFVFLEEPEFVVVGGLEEVGGLCVMVLFLRCGLWFVVGFGRGKGVGLGCGGIVHEELVCE